VLILLSVPLFGLLADLRADVAQLRLAAMGAQASGAISPTGQVQAVLQAAACQTAAAEAAVEALAIRPMPWRAILERALPEPGSAVRITSLRQERATLTIEGVAASEAFFQGYLTRLQGTPFLDVASLQASTNSTSPGAISFTIDAQLRGDVP